VEDLSLAPVALLRYLERRMLCLRVTLLVGWAGGGAGCCEDGGGGGKVGAPNGQAEVKKRGIVTEADGDAVGAGFGLGIGLEPGLGLGLGLGVGRTGGRLVVLGVMM